MYFQFGNGQGYFCGIAIYISFVGFYSRCSSGSVERKRESIKNEQKKFAFLRFTTEFYI